MQCSRMHLSERRYKPPPRVSQPIEGDPIARPCLQRFALNELPQRYSSSRSYRSTSPQTSNSDQSGDAQKTPLMIVDLKISPDTKTLAPKSLKRSAKKLPPFCVQYQNALSKSSVMQDSNMKTINDFIVQGTLINSRRSKRHHHNSPDIIVNCGDDECDECKELEMCESDIAMNVFNNINTDLLLSLDCYEMDSYGRLPGDSRTPTPVPNLTSSNVAPSSDNMPISSSANLLAVPAGYRPLSLRTPSPNTRSIIRIDLVNRDAQKSAEPNIKEINYNVNRLKEKRGVRYKDEKSTL